MTLTPLTPENYQAIVKALHPIADSEFLNLSVFQGGKEAVDTSISFLLNTNSNGVLAQEFLDSAVERYNNDPEFRHIWGSIAMNMEMVVKYTLGMRIDIVASSILTGLTADKDLSMAFDLTPSQTVSHRLDLFTRMPELDFCHPSDWWLVCLILFRLTIHESESVKAYVVSAIRAGREGGPVKTKKPTKTTFENKLPTAPPAQ